MRNIQISIQSWTEIFQLSYHTRDIYICNRDATEKFMSDSDFKSRYLT